MDQRFEMFKPAYGKSALRVASKKMQKRMEVRLLNAGARNDKDGNAVIDVDASDALSEDEKELDEIEDSYSPVSTTTLQFTTIRPVLYNPPALFRSLSTIC